jgi:hypothetical protein
MDNKSKIFFAVFSLLFVGSIAATYHKTLVLQDYMIEAEAPCDPYTESCFVYICNPIEEECTGDPEEDTSYYKNISRNAKYIPRCDTEDESCDALVCPPDEADCSMTLCDPATATEDMICNNPTAYALLHPIEDEVSDEEGDEEILLDEGKRH